MVRHVPHDLTGTGNWGTGQRDGRRSLPIAYLSLILDLKPVLLAPRELRLSRERRDGGNRGPKGTVGTDVGRLALGACRR